MYGRSFFAAGMIMALLAIPLIVAATREGLAQLPAQLREASYALGKTSATTIRRVLLPAVRQDMASGIALGMGRIIGDTAIVVILLGATLRLEGAGGAAGPVDPARHRIDAHRLRLPELAGGRRQRRAEGLRGRVRAADAGSAPQLPVTRLSSRALRVGEVKPVTPPPVRRITVERSADAWPSRPRPAATTCAGHRRPARPRAGLPAPVGRSTPIERMRIESVSLAYGERWVVRDVTLPVRQGEVLALIGASGSGKTTLLRALNRLTEVTASASRAGRITLDGREIGDIEVTDLRRRVSMVFQQPNPFPMSIFENVAYALREERPAGRSWLPVAPRRPAPAGDRRTAPCRTL